MALFKIKLVDKHIVEGIIEADTFDQAVKKSKDKYAYIMKEKSYETVYEEFLELTTGASKVDDIPVTGNDMIR